MATVGEIVDEPLVSDLNTTNGDTSKLEYSGISEDNLDCADANKSITDAIASEFNEDLDEHGAPAPSAKAIRREINENHSFNDDDFPKTLTTLETVKKPIQSNDGDDTEICPIETEDDEFEEEPILLEVVNDDDENKIDDETIDLQKTVTYRKTKIATLANDVRTKLQTAKINNKILNSDAVATPNKPIPTPSAGTIEIPRELITSDVDVISPVIINHIKTPTANSDDLIAILEGDDNSSVNASVEHYEFSLTSGKANGEQKIALTAEQEREIAMEQIMSLPKKKKGRPKLNPLMKAARETKLAKKPKNAALVNSLVSDWEENEAKQHNDSTETEIVVEIRPQKKQTIVEPVQPTFRRSRIIKKKIIWDPDAPETAINYASLAHTSGAGPLKRLRKKKDSEPSDECSITDDVPLPLIPPPKKKKTSEIDKLLGDEGAANMLNSLHQGNNNNNKVNGTSPGKIPRTKPIKVEPCNVQNAIQQSANKAKAPKVKEVKEPSPQKQTQNANKKNVTPKSVAAGKKRGPKPSDGSWDYVYKSRPDDCMIIRRRSNSSYSSTASLNRTSIDLPNAPYVGDFDGTDTDHDFETQAKRSRNNKDKTFEFAKPKAKKIGKFDNDAKYQSTFDEAKNSGVDVNSVFDNNTTKKHVKSDEIDVNAIPVKLGNDNDQDTSFTQISVCRFENFSQIIIQPYDADSKSLLTIQVCEIIDFYERQI